MIPTHFKVAGNPLAIGRITGDIHVSRLFQLRATTGLRLYQPALTELLGEPFEVTLTDATEQALVISGVVTEAARRISQDGLVALKLMLEPAVAPLARGQDCRLFQELSAVDIIKKVLREADVNLAGVSWSLAGSYPVRPYCVQYRESNWAFIERLLAEEGIIYRFDFSEQGTTLVFFDDSCAAPLLQGGAALRYVDVSGELPAHDCVYHLSMRTQLVSEGARLIDYDFNKPQLKLESATGNAVQEIYDIPGRFSEPAEGDRLAKVMLEGLQAGRRILLGSTNSSRVHPGRIAEVSNYPVTALNGAYLICSLQLDASAETNASATDKNAVSREPSHTALRWTAIAADQPLRMMRPRATAQSGGPQTGVVVGTPGEEIHPDMQGRIRVQHFWDRQGQCDDGAGTWMRVGQFALGGSMVLPRIGWEVMVHHREGDIDAPQVITHLYNGQHRVPYALPANKTRSAWQTATTPGDGSSNELRFEDAAGNEQLFINATKDMNVIIGDNKIENVGVDLSQDIGANLDISVGANHSRQVTTDQDVSIGGSEALTISGNRAVSVDGSETCSVGGSRAETALLGKELTSEGGRTLTVGGSMLDIAALGVNRMTLGSQSVTVAGSWVSAAATGVSAITLGAGAETVGGAKICAGASGVETSVKGALAETVGGAYVIAAGSDAGEKASGPLAVTVGGALLGNASKIEIEADSKISIRAGASTLTITSSSIELRAPTILAPGGGIKKKASTIKHN